MRSWLFIWLFMGSAPDLAAPAGRGPASAAVLRLIVIALAIMAVCAVAAWFSAMLGRLWDDPAAGLMVLGGLGLLIWGLVSGHTVAAIIGGLAVGAGLLGMESY